MMGLGPSAASSAATSAAAVGLEQPAAEDDGAQCEPRPAERETADDV